MWEFLKPKKRAHKVDQRASEPVVALVPVALVPTAVAAPAGVAYDANLIKKLKDEHVEILSTYTRILTSATSGGIGAIAEDLIMFRRLFQNHILRENLHFYMYLDYLLTDLPSERDTARILRNDMNSIAKSVAEFIYQWSSVAPTNETLPSFTSQLLSIGAALAARIELEECTLYTLYVGMTEAT